VGEGVLDAGVVAIASDHGGVALKDVLKAALQEDGRTVLDLGTEGSASVDYPVFAARMAEALAKGEAACGVLICGTGIGISIAANRFAHVRAALVHDAFGAKLCRQHNDANVIAFGGRTIGEEVAKDCLRVFLSTPFEGGRHERRVAMMGPR